MSYWIKMKNILGNVSVSKKVKSTLYITKDKREKIRQSGLSIEEYCNRLFEIQEKFNVANWKDGFLR